MDPLKSTIENLNLPVIKVQAEISWQTWLNLFLVGAGLIAFGAFFFLLVNRAAK